MAEFQSQHGECPTGRLAHFAATLRYDDLPPSVVERMKDCLLDSLGCSFLGNTLDGARHLIGVTRELGSAPQATIFGTASRASMADAALVNASAAHAFEFDAVHNRGSLQVASLVVPAALAIAEGAGKASGRELLVAMTAGAEAALRIGCAASAGLFQRGFQAHAVCGTYAAGLAAGRMLQLDARKMRQAMGHCGSQSAGLNAAQGEGDAKSLQGGRAAQSGVLAALLARSGSAGIDDVLGANPGGFFSAFTGVRDAGAAVDSGLGERWEVLDIGFKPYPVNGAVGSAVETLDQLMRRHRLSAGDIAEVVAAGSARTIHHCGEAYRPGGRHAAQMSLPYGLSLMAVRRAVSASDFLGGRFDDPQLLAFAQRVRTEVEPRFDAAEYRLASRLRVHTRGGAEYEAETLVRPGDPRRPMSRDALRAKFRELGALAMPPGRLDEIEHRVDQLEKLEDCRELASLLGVDEAANAGRGRVVA